MAFAGTRLLKIKIGASEYNASITSAKIVSAASDSDFQTFNDAATGGARVYTLAFTAGSDYAAATLWDQVFSNAGTTVACVLNPYGVVTFAAATPGFSFNAVIKEPDGDYIGTDANPSVTAMSQFSVEWVLTAKPTRLVSGTY